MALLKTKEINQVVNSSINGFYEMKGLSIRDMAGQIQTSASASASHVEQNPRTVSSPLGYIIAFMKNALSSDPGIREVNEMRMKVLYIKWAETAYSGQPVEFRVHKYAEEDALEQQCITDMKNRAGWSMDPQRLLEMYIDGHACGVFVPEWKCFVPAAGFRDRDVLQGQTPEDYLNANPHVRDRLRAMLGMMLSNGANRPVLETILAQLGGPLTESEQAVYRAEMKETVSDDIANYIGKTAGINPEIVCGYMGTNTADKLLDTVTLISTGTNAITGRDMKRVTKTMAAIPPVQNTDSISNPVFKFGNPAGQSGQELPEWIEFTARLDGILYHKVFAFNETAWKICRPKNYVDLFYGVPDGILSRFNYLIQDSEVPASGGNEVDSLWKIYPEDPKSNIARLESEQYQGEWEILQRSERITRMELYDEQGNVLGAIFPESAPVFARKNNTVYVAFDPAGAVSVRLMTVAGSGRSEAVSYSDMVHPLTPMAKGELDQAIKRRITAVDGTKTHFDSLLQNFFPKTAGAWARLMVESRIWQPDQKELFEVLKEYPGTMSMAMTGIGVVSNPKEMIARSNLKPAEREACMSALKMYIGAMMFEAVLGLAKEGYAVQADNLEFMISYPENGSGEGVTKFMNKAIMGALELVNEFLSPQNQLVKGGNVTLYSESEATAQWHKNNPPTGAFMGDLVAVGTPDYGHSTHDYSLRVNGHLYMFSIPYAAQNITNATLAKVYDGRPLALMRCFSNGSQELIRGAESAIEKAMESGQGKLYERLAFILPLNRLFSDCRFCVTGANTDTFQLLVQQIVEAKLNVAIPAYAQSIARAVRAGDLQVTSNVLLAPVGKGSLAINNTSNTEEEGRFEERFIDRIKAQIARELGEEFTGTIQLLPNNDTDKVSVAQGLLDLKEAGNTGPAAVLVPVPDPTEHYLDLVYDADEDAKTQFRAELAAVNGRAFTAQFNKMKEQLYDTAFEKIMDSYRYEDFESSFDCWGHTGTGEGIFDDMIRVNAQENFENLMAELKQNRKSLIMSCPGIEKEMICGAMIDLVIERYEVA